MILSSGREVVEIQRGDGIKDALSTDGKPLSDAEWDEYCNYLLQLKRRERKAANLLRIATNKALFSQNRGER